jgi:PAS domain S-box-containing protein
MRPSLRSFRLTEGHLLSVNAAMARMMGYASPGDMLSTMTDSLWSGAVSSQRMIEFRDAIEADGYVKAFELEVYRKDRSTAWISATVRSVLKDGILTGFEGMCEDITERKLLREQLLNAQKLESVGQLAAGIAHEINTPAQYIGDNIRFLKDTFHDLTDLLAIYGNLLNEARSNNLMPAIIEAAVAAQKNVNLNYLLPRNSRSHRSGLGGRPPCLNSGRRHEGVLAPRNGGETSVGPQSRYPEHDHRSA